MDVSAATLSVVVKNVGIAETQAQLDALGKAGDRVAGKFDAAFKQSSASAMDFARAGATANQIAMLTGQSLNSAKDAVQRFGGQAAIAAGELHGLALAQQEMASAGIRVTPVVENATKAISAHTMGLGTLRSSLASTVTAMSGLPPQLTMITSQLGVMGAGFVPIIAALAVVAAGVAIWRLWTEETRKAAEEQEKLTKAAEDWYKTQKEGAAGQHKLQLAAEKVLIVELTAQYEALKIKIDQASKAGGGDAGSTSSTFSSFAGGIGSSGTLFQSMAGGVGSQGNVFVSEAAKSAAAEVKKILDLKSAVAKALQDAIDESANDDAVKIQAERLAKLEFAWEQAAVGINKAVESIANQVGEMKKANDEGEKMIRLATQNAALARTEGLSHDLLANAYKAENEQLAARAQYSGPALTQMLADIEATKKINDATILYNHAQSERLRIMKEIADIGAKNKAITDKQQTETADQIKAAQKYVDDIRKIYADGFLKIITDGMKSWHDFFDDVFQMFSKLMDRMAKEGKSTKGLGAITAAIGGGVAGYQIGQSTGSTAGGLLGGAASGAMLGNQILPGGWGAAIGGLTGAAGGLLGAAQAHKEAAQKLSDASANLAKNIAAFTATNSLASGIASVKGTADSLRDVAKAIWEEYNHSHSSGAGTRAMMDQYQSALNGINAGEAMRIAQLVYEDHLIRANFLNDQQVRQMRARGLTAEAQAMQDALDRGKELQDAIKQFGASSEEVAQLMITQAMEMNNAAFAAFSTKNQAAFAANIQAMNDKIAADKAAQDELRQIAQEQLDVQQEALSVASKQLDLQQKTVDGLRQTVDALRKYQDSLKLSNLSPLSANDRYLEAKRQYDIVAKAAAGGDQGAAQNLPQVANAFLTESKAMFGSSGRFAQDFAQVQTLTSLLGDQFDAQLTVEDKILAELKIQTSAMSYQIAVLTAQLHQSAYDAALARQTYVVGSPKDPNFLVQNGVPGAVTGLPPWDPMSPTGMALAASMSGGGGSSGGGPRDTSMAAFTSWKAKHSGAGDEASWGMTYDDWISIGSPSFARGGSFGGGARLVGERGPELEITGPSRIAPLSALGEATTDEVKKLNVMIAALLVETKNQTKAINRKRELAGTN